MEEPRSEEANYSATDGLRGDTYRYSSYVAVAISYSTWWSHPTLHSDLCAGYHRSKGNQVWLQNSVRRDEEGDHFWGGTIHR